jgi:threonine dehydrogenase-like Zn-dependent dehydrogenase
MGNRVEGHRQRSRGQIAPRAWTSGRTLRVVRAVVARDHQLVVDEVAAPTPSTGDALVALRACGICGSDLHTLRHAEHMTEVAAATGLESTFDPTADYHLGHEWVGEVLELAESPDASPVGVGDLVVSVPYLVRGAGLVPLGFSNDYYAGYAEQFLLTAAVCVPVPNGLDVRRAALTEPMAVGLHTVNRSEITQGAAAVVVGCGPIGLALIAWLAARRIEPIVASDPSEQRRGLATALGAHEVVDPRVEPVFDAWRRVAGLGAMQPPVVFEAVGIPGMLDELLFTVPSQTRVMVAGVCMQPDTIRPLLGIVKEVSLDFVYGYEAEEFADTLRAIAEGDVDVSAFVTGTVGFDGVTDAFATLERADDHVKILIEPDGPASPTPVEL